MKTKRFVRKYYFHNQILALLFLGFLGFLRTCHATCSITNPMTVSLGNATLSGNSIVIPTSAKNYQYSFLIACNVATSYRLTINNNDQQPTENLTINNSQGDAIAVTAKLKSVAGNPINMEFNKLPGGFYTGSIAADQKQQVIVELSPLGVQSKNKRVSGGNFTGNGTIKLIY